MHEELEGAEIDAVFSAPKMVMTIHDMMEGEYAGMLYDDPGEHVPDSSPEDVELVLLSGTALAEEDVDMVDAAFPDARTIPLYTSSWFGTAWPPADYPEREDRTPEYHLNPEYPFEVVDPDTGEEVGYGERGRLEFTVANEGVFIPRIREDMVTRIRPQKQFDHDGVRSVGRA